MVTSQDPEKTALPHDATSEARDVTETPTIPLNRDEDIAIAIVGEQSHAFDPVIEARIVRKIDLFFIPAMVIGYGLVYYDKAILGSAVLFGMTTDLSLSTVNTHTNPPTTSTDRLSWATSLFYFGMLAGLYPMTFALQRFSIRRVLPPLIIFWSLICMLTAAVTTWRGLYVQRFFLGFVESIIPTTFMCIISSFYTQKEQALRQSWWFSSTGLFTIIGGALNYGFGQIQGGSLKRWQYIYLLAGSLTFLFGVLCFAVPDSPVDAWFLTKEERVVAVERLRRGQTGVRCTKFKMSQVRESVLDIKVWLVAIMMASAYTVNGAVSGFGPLIVSTFGYSTLDSILFQFPLGFICLIFILITGYLCTIFRNIRILLLILNCLPVIAGCAMIWRASWFHHAAAPVVGYTIIGFFGPVVSLIITIGMSNVAGQTKKCFMAATIFVAYCVGNIVGPQLIKSQTKQRHYPELWLGLIICYCITIVSSAALYFVLARENAKRRHLELNEIERDKSAFHDLTDKENPYFEYML
ncbi:major facilitator superfamily domain-containing protein [Xylogone sp. PMI_703]|nr:major facilitator superfamily domain-containing protein [Xylogone sp. PMI_703]